jgi:lipoprotein Spr/probable lipoprotein NlpC
VPRTCALQVNSIKRKYEEELKEGDLVFFDFDGKQYSHVGVYLQNGYIVHAGTRKGVIIVKLHDQGIYKYFSRAGSVIDSTTSAQND